MKRYYSSIEANIYLLRLQEAGIRCFLSQENISTILPLSDGGVFLNVAEEDIAEAKALMEKIAVEIEENKDAQDFREATKEDIMYEKSVVEYEKKLEGGWLNYEIISVVIFMLFFVVVVAIIINYFFPFY